MNDIKIRIVKKSDAEELLSIYAPYVENTAITFECDVPSVHEFENRIERTLESYPYIAAECGGEIIGYACASSFKDRAAYDWAVETTVYVRKDRRKAGVGKLLYCTLEKLLAMQNILNLNACIAYIDEEDEHLTNGSMHFHERLGYTLVGKFRKCGYKFGNWYDMIWMEKHIGEHRNNPPAVKKFSEIRKMPNFGHEFFNC